MKYNFEDTLLVYEYIGIYNKVTQLKFVNLTRTELGAVFLIDKELGTIDHLLVI